MRFLPTLALLAFLPLAMPSPATATAAPPAPASERVRGIFISTHGGGREWGEDEIASTLDDIRAVGAGWVAIHPYARIDEDGSVRYREFDPTDPPAYLARPIQEAHARGMKIAVMPHLAYWGSSFGWRGEIEFRTEAEWARFFSDYERWIVAVARACREADGFVVGNELDRTVSHEAEWRRIIARVREATPAALSYAANWSDYRSIPFWDALDAIGIQACFPLSEEPRPSNATVEPAWRVRMKELREFSALHRRKIVFTELGYNRSFTAAQAPWDYRSDGAEAEPFQASLLGAALRSIEKEPAVAGVFLWKWFRTRVPWELSARHASVEAHDLGSLAPVGAGSGITGQRAHLFRRNSYVLRRRL